eukprot:2759372-Prymnesium_polylepis.1
MPTQAELANAGYSTVDEYFALVLRGQSSLEGVTFEGEYEVDYKPKHTVFAKEKVYMVTYKGHRIRAAWETLITKLMGVANEGKKVTGKVHNTRTNIRKAVEKIDKPEKPKRMKRIKKPPRSSFGVLA